MGKQNVFRCDKAPLYEGRSVGLSVRPSVGRSVGRSVTPSHFRRFRHALEHCVASIGFCLSNKVAQSFSFDSIDCSSDLDGVFDRFERFLVELSELQHGEIVVLLVAKQNLDVLLLHRLHIRRILCHVSAKGNLGESTSDRPECLHLS